MARKVFFSFHYDNDVSRAMIVRNSGMTKAGISEAGFMDHADFEELQKKGSAAVRKWIDDQLYGSSVTVVLIGAETLTRPFVKYELEQSYKRGNAILGVYINSIKDFNERTTIACSTYGIQIGNNSNGLPVYFHYYDTYNWILDNGYENLGKWVEAAAKKAGK